MFKNLKVMVVTWGVILTLLVGLGVIIEISYTPSAKPAGNAANAAVPISSASASVTLDAQSINANGALSLNKIKSSETVGDADITILPPPTFVVTQEDPELLELSPEGVLPKRGSDGKVSWQTYISPVIVDDNKPSISIIVTDMGLNKKLTASAIERLPASVSFAFSPYGEGLDDLRNLSRSTGHELLMLLPMEPINYPQSDPGKYSLQTSQSTLENIHKLKIVMSKMVGYVGIMNHMGSKFMTLQPNLGPILNEINIRGLMFVDSGSTQFSRGGIIAQGIGLPRAINDSTIDEIISESSILQELQKIEDIAKSRGVAVGVIHNYPLSTDILLKWIDSLPSKGFQLVPITSTVNRQPIRLDN